jgi:hypothetical protein
VKGRTPDQHGSKVDSAASFVKKAATGRSDRGGRRDAGDQRSGADRRSTRRD